MKPHKCREPRPFLTRRTLARLIAGALLAGAQAAHAQNLNLDLPAQSLEGALASVARQSGLQLALDPALAAGRNAPALNGQYTTAQALNRLLAGTGLQAVRRGETLVIQPALRGGDVQLAPVTVTAGTGYSGTTEGTGSYAQKGPSRAATRLALTPKETPQSVSVVTRQRLDDQRLDSIYDVLNATIGVSTFRQSVGADLDQPYSRGFSVSNFLVDGVPRSSAGSISTSQNTALFDRVEVLRGATGLTSGMGYPGASINMVRKRPTHEAQASLSLEAGSWDRYGVGLDTSGPLTDSGHIRGRLVIDQKNQRSWLDRYEARQSLIYGIAEMDLGTDTLLTLGFSHQKNDNDSSLRSGVPIYYSDGSKIGLPRSYNNAPDWSYYDMEDSHAFASLRHGFANGWKASLELSYLEDSHDAISYWHSGSIDRTTGLGQSIAPARWEGDARGHNVDASLSGDFFLFGRSHEFVAGFSLYQRKERGPGYGSGGWLWTWNSSYDGTIDSPIWDWDGSQANYPEFTKSSDGKIKTTEQTAYFSSRFNLADPLNLIVGARLMNWERVNETRPLSGTYSKTATKETGVVVPYAGLTYDLSDTWTAYGSYTQIFRPQSASVVDIDRRPLDPEEGTAYEIGVKTSFREEKLNASLALFKVDQDRVAEYDASISAYRSLEGIHTQGAEVELSGELADYWNISAGYAYSVSKDEEGRRVMKRLPNHTVKVFTTYRLPGELSRWTVGGGATWQSRSGWGWENTDDDGKNDQRAYVLVNLMMRYKLSDSTEIMGNLNNVFDKKYYTALLNDIGLYGPPRNLMLSLKHKF